MWNEVLAEYCIVAERLLHDVFNQKSELLCSSSFCLKNPGKGSIIFFPLTSDNFSTLRVHRPPSPLPPPPPKKNNISYKIIYLNIKYPKLNLAKLKLKYLKVWFKCKSKRKRRTNENIILSQKFVFLRIQL